MLRAPRRASASAIRWPCATSPRSGVDAPARAEGGGVEVDLVDDDDDDEGRVFFWTRSGMETKRRRRHARAMPHGYPIFKKRTHGDVCKQRSTLMRQLDFYLEECLRRKIRGALVFDIDETLIGEQTRRPIRAVHALYDKYRTHFPTYLVSARGEDAYKYTVDELARHGIGGYRKLMELPKRGEAHCARIQGR